MRVKLKFQRILCAILTVLLVITGLYIDQNSYLSSTSMDFDTSTSSCLTDDISDSDDQICTVDMLSTQSSMLLKQTKNGSYEKENLEKTTLSFLGVPNFSLRLFTPVSNFRVENGIYSFLNNSLIQFIQDSDGKKRI